MAISYRCAGRHRGVCDYEADERWVGPCPNCNRFYDAEPRGIEGEKIARTAASQIATAIHYKSSGMPGVDKVLGGGFVFGNTYIISGPPGTGKSTLLLQLADAFAKTGYTVTFACPEMNQEQVGQYIQRLGLLNDDIHVLGLEGDVEKVVDFVDDTKAKLLILDSLQKSFSEEVDGAVGSPSQCNAVIEHVVYYAKKSKVTAIIVSHVNSQGEIAGGTGIQHDVDALLEFDPVTEIDEDGEDVYEGKEMRRLTIGKTRQGKSGVSALFEMTDTAGVFEVEEKPKKPSKIVTLEEVRTERAKKSKLLA